MTTKTLLRAMTLLAAAGGAVAILLPFFDRQAQAKAPSPKRRRTTPRAAGTVAPARAQPEAEKAKRGTHARRSGNGDPPSHH